MVAAAPELQAAFGAGITGLTDRLEASGSQAAQAFLSGFRVFQHDYGSRAERTGDPVADLGDPSRAGAVGHRSHEVGPAHCLAGRCPGSQAAAREAAAAELLAMVEADPETHGQLAAALRAATVWLPARERRRRPTTSASSTRPARAARARTADGGSGCVRRRRGLRLPGRLAEMDGPFPRHAFTDDVRRRRAQYLDLSAREPTFVFVGDSLTRRRGRGGTMPCSRASRAEPASFRASRAAPAWPRAGPAWCSTPTIPAPRSWRRAGGAHHRPVLDALVRAGRRCRRRRRRRFEPRRQSELGIPVSCRPPRHPLHPRWRPRPGWTAAPAW